MEVELKQDQDKFIVSIDTTALEKNDESDKDIVSFIIHLKRSLKENEKEELLEEIIKFTYNNPDFLFIKQINDNWIILSPKYPYLEPTEFKLKLSTIDSLEGTSVRTLEKEKKLYLFFNMIKGIIGEQIFIEKLKQNENSLK